MWKLTGVERECITFLDRQRCIHGIVQGCASGYINVARIGEKASREANYQLRSPLRGAKN